METKYKKINECIYKLGGILAVADKFYTKNEVAEECYNFLKNKLELSGDELFLEPTAGGGAFLDYLKNFEAYDILPEDPRITKMNIFDFTSDKKDFITIGNPPFGKRSKLAIEVFNKCAEYSEVIGFILPVSFMKFGVQKELDKNFKLVDFFFLEENSFMDRDKEYDVNCVFQLWVKEGSKYDKFENKRITKSPSTTHEDFKLWQYNATPEALKSVDEDWEFAVLRQGYGDYNKIYYPSQREEVREMMTGKKKKQFFFIKPLNDKARDIVKKMDFNNLAARNTSTPGFGKGDFVSYYVYVTIMNSMVQIHPKA